MKRFSFSILLFCYLGLATLTGQNYLLSGSSRHKVGFMTGYGEQFPHENRYIYNPFFIEVQYSYALIRMKMWGLEVLAQPQYNFTSYAKARFSMELLKGHEFGLNLGLLLRNNFCSDRISLYAAASIGPHYASDAPDRQSAGFLWSDNLFVGFNILIRKNLYLDLRTGMRHLSNAEMKQPNKGLNNYLYKAGFMIVL